MWVELPHYLAVLCCNMTTSFPILVVLPEGWMDYQHSIRYYTPGVQVKLMRPCTVGWFGASNRGTIVTCEFMCRCLSDPDTLSSGRLTVPLEASALLPIQSPARSIKGQLSWGGGGVCVGGGAPREELSWGPYMYDAPGYYLSCSTTTNEHTG